MRALIADGVLRVVAAPPDGSADVTIGRAVEMPCSTIDVPHAVAIAAGRYLGREARVLLVIDEDGDDVVRAEVLRAIDLWQIERASRTDTAAFVVRMRALVGAS